MSTAFVPTQTVRQDALSAKGAIAVHCKIVGGQLLPAFAPVRVNGTVPDNVTRARFCPGTGRTFLWADGKVYSSLIGTSFVQLAALAAQSPFIVEEYTPSGFQSLIIGDKIAIVYRGNIQTSSSFGGNLSCGVMRYGRLFGADASDGFMFRWSGEGGALNWPDNIMGAGWAYPKNDLGKILNVVDFNSQLILVRENGLTSVNARGTPETYAIDQDFYAPSIRAETAAVVGGSLYFCTAYGLYRFTGSEVTAVDDELFDGMTSTVFGAAFGERYLVCGGHVSRTENVIYLYDASDKTSYLCDAPATAVCASDRAIAYGGGAAYVLTEGGAPYTFTSGKLTFGTVREKVLEKLVVESDEGVDVTLSNGVHSRIFEGVRGELKLDMRGEWFTVTVTGKGIIRGLTACAEVERGV